MELVEFQAQHRSDHPAYTFLEDGEREGPTLDFAALLERSRALAARLQSEGAAGERVLLLFPAGLDYVVSFLACALAGATAVPAYPPDPTRIQRSVSRLLAIVEDADARFALTLSGTIQQSANLQRLAPGLQALRWLAADETPLEAAADWHRPDLSPDTLAFLQYTSGSTGAPKGVMVTHGNLLHNQHLIRLGFDHSQVSTFVGWLPLYHDMGLVGNMLQPLYIGARCILMSPAAFLEQPLRWLAAISRYRAHTSGGPNFAYDLCIRRISPDQRAQLDLSSWRTAFVGAEPVRSGTLARFVETFAPCGFRREALYPCYGLAEATLIVTGGTPTEDPVIGFYRQEGIEQGRADKAWGIPNAVPLVSSGRPLGGQQVAIVDPMTREPVPPGVVGEVWVSGPSVAAGYRGRQALSTETFHAQLASGDGPFLRTGDLGFLDGKELFITGRRKDLIILRGRNLYPQDLELTVEQCHPALRPGCCAAFPVEVEGEEQLVVVQEIAHKALDADPDSLLPLIRQALAEQHDVQVYAIVLVAPGTLPKTSSGKIQRHRMRRRFLDADLKPLATWHAELTRMSPAPQAEEPPSSPEPDDALEWLQQALAERLHTAADRIDVRQPMRAYSLDSLNALELRFQIEARFGRLLPLETLFKADSVEAAAILLQDAESAREVPLARADATPGEFSPSPGQRALWLLNRLEPESPAYHVSSALRVTGPLSLDALRLALESLVLRHPLLRARFPARDGAPILHIPASAPPPLTLVDATDWSAERLRDRLEQDAFLPFDLERGPLLRICLYRIDADHHVLLLSQHHIITDFWSQAVLLADLEALYTAARDGSSPALSPTAPGYPAYVSWQNSLLDGPEGQALEAWWRETLRDAPPQLDLPRDRPRPPVQTTRGATWQLSVEPATLEGLQALAHREGTSLFPILLCAFGVLLARHTGQRDLVIGAPFLGRSRGVFAGTVGYCVNPLPIRLRFGPDDDGSHAIAMTRTAVLEALDHQDLPFVTLVERLKPVRDPSIPPVFQVMCTLQQAPPQSPDGLTGLALGLEGIRLPFADLELESLALPQHIAQFDLSLSLGVVDDRLIASFDYNSDLFDQDRITRLGGHYHRLLEALATHPATTIWHLPLLTGLEAADLKRWNATDATPDTRAPQTVHALIEAQAGRTPEAIAVRDPAHQLSYRTLDRRANALARRLWASGTGPEQRVGVLLDRSVDLLVAILGVLKAGAAWLPLDPDAPEARLATLLADGDAARVVTIRALRDRVPGGIEAVCLDEPASHLEPEDRMTGSLPARPATPGCGMDSETTLEADTAPDVPVDAHHLACILYTSGSTGAPRGVQLEHRGVVNLVRSFLESYSPTPADRLLPLTAPTSASFVGEILPLLAVGGTLVLPGLEQSLNPAALLELLSEAEISIVSTVPAMMRLLNARLERLPKLRLLLSGGEALDAADVDRLLERVTVVNSYGTTEGTVCSTSRVLQRDDLLQHGGLPIGTPIRNTRCHVLDAALEPLPVGCEGDLYVSGDGLARGYQGQPALTAWRFLPDPFRPGARMYRTGDRARWRSDGSLDYVGRSDHQIKLRGFRIEPGEIEATLRRHDAVRDATVGLRADVPGEVGLVAWVVADSDRSLDPDTLRTWLRERLPGTMVPAAIVLIDTLPLLPNGKLDLRSLPAPDRMPSPERPLEAPCGRIERLVAEIWREILKIEVIGLHDNFFDLGGHSLLLTRVHERLQAALERRFPLTELFRFPTVHALAAFLSGGIEPAIKDSAADRNPVTWQEAIAIIGMSGRFPLAENPESLWEHLISGRECISFFSEDELLAEGADPALLEDPHYIRARGILGDIDRFDAGFFGLSPREVELMDPQHRVLLEVAWEALEQAGYAPGTPPRRTGVFAGGSMNTYFMMNLLPHLTLVPSAESLQAALGNDKDPMTARIAYKLDLKGPSVTVQTASSTSLVAVHLACQSLLGRDCDMALAGGVSIHVPEKAGYMYQPGGTTSPDGHCRAFDARGQGFVSGHGAGLVVLKRLSDALEAGDHIHAIIRGSACNNDGALKVSFMAPSVEGQVEVYRLAHAAAGVRPDQLSYIECHGTATVMGDPIEVTALTQAFRAETDRRQFCAIGSIKTNIGHLDVAAGVCGLIKTALALEHRMLPASLHFQEPNPRLDLERSPFFVNTHLRPWETDALPRRAGVTSLGMGGTNAHLILEEPPPQAATTSSRPWHLLTWSAHSLEALEAHSARLARHLEANPTQSLPDVAWSLMVGRKPLPLRRIAVVSDLSGAIAALKTGSGVETLTPTPGTRSVVFLFPGQGSQHLDMGLELYQHEPVFREVLDRCAALLEPHLGFDLRTLLYPEGASRDEATSRLAHTAAAQPALFSVEYALARLWIARGIMPTAMIGHSLGETVAACLAGVFSLEAALELVALRGKLMGAMQPGAMLAVPLSADEVLPWLGADLSLAAVNEDQLSVVSGPLEAIATLEALLTARNMRSHRLQTSHAFHSAMMEPALEPFAAAVARARPVAPSLPFLSNLTGDWISAAQCTSPDYWASQLRQAVLFAPGLRRLLEEPNRVLLEIGPGTTLSGLAARHPARCGQPVIASMRHARAVGSDFAHLLQAQGRLWGSGVSFDTAAVYRGERRRRVPLPTYPFQRQRFWVAPGPRLDGPVSGAPSADSSGQNKARSTPAGRLVPRPAGEARRPLDAWFEVPTWVQDRLLPSVRVDARLRDQERDLPTHLASVQPEGPPSLVLILADDGGVGDRMAMQLRAGGVSVAIARRGAGFAVEAPAEFSLSPALAGDANALAAALEHPPTHVVHLWSLDCTPETPLRTLLELGFHGVLRLLHALTGRRAGRPLSLLAVTRDAWTVQGDEPEIDPRQVLLTGLCQVAPLEDPRLHCVHLDVTLPGSKDGVEVLARRILSAWDPDQRGPFALRGGYRWRQMRQPVTLEASPTPHPRLRPRGVYLVTGGLGGLGFEVARALAERWQARLVITSRSIPPEDPTATGDGARLPDGSEQATDPSRVGPSGELPQEIQRRARRRERLQKLEALGADLLVLQADVTRHEDMARVLDAALTRFGSLHGVIHAAGVPGGQLLTATTPEALEATLAPKVVGAQVLDAVLRDQALDWMLFFSSLTAFVPVAGQSAYLAANAYLDALAHARSSRGQPTVSIDWDGWLEVGMAVETPVPTALRPLRDATLEHGIHPSEGVEALWRVLAAGWPQMIVSPVPLEHRQARYQALTGALDATPGSAMNAGEARNIDGVQDEASNGSNWTQEPTTLEGESHVYPRPSLSTPFVAPSDPLEARIAALWEQILRVGPVGIRDNFFELGGNSLLGLQLINRIRTTLNVPLSDVSLYEGPTVQSLAALIRPSSPGPEETTRRGRSRGERRRARRLEQHGDE